ncbi:mannosyl-oligosaccharide 1,2-alpha-mannosidase [Saccharomyces eubayanus]|uniref:mannosyl-oligosaccharide 1,2-alpha-mannosidase n=1 Tax=Saccharomyces eubayanus TaxID=1080349 RepID=UPI0006C0F617|nr:MNS1-like protein [Saccharomyces eubayanus]KOG98710.1 MNS1-like protein [Saccharomyces eubayanus]
MRGLVATIIAIVATIYYVPWKAYFKQKPEASREMRDRIETMFLASWMDYSKYGWGYDIYGPIDHSFRNMPRGGQPLGWIIVDSLDTLMLMYNSSALHKSEFEAEILKSEHWIDTVLDFDIDAEVNVFETTIRMLGGLLSAYHYSEQFEVGNKTVYLNKAIDLGDRLALAFISTQKGIPYSSVNLHSGQAIKNHVNGGASSTAEFTTLQMEFKYLAYLTENSTYWKMVERVYEPLYKTNDLLNVYDGLVPIYTFPNTGRFSGFNIRFGSRGDSFYEYLLKQYLLTHETLYYDLYRKSMDGMKKHLLARSKPSFLSYIGERERGLNGVFSSKMDHLVCFMGGLLASGATEGLPVHEARRRPFWDTDRENDWDLAKELTNTCYQMYNQTPSGLAPEIVVFNQGKAAPRSWWQSSLGDFFVKPFDKHNMQRPETVESIMFMYQLSRDKKYRQWGAEITSSFYDNTCVSCNDAKLRRFASLSDCITLPTKKTNNMESFWLAETLKYLYILFLDDFDLTKVVFNTEAHPFPVLDKEVLKSQHLTTGWSL